jgi:hypothetical protein
MSVLSQEAEDKKERQNNSENNRPENVESQDIEYRIVLCGLQQEEQSSNCSEAVDLSANSGFHGKRLAFLPRTKPRDDAGSGFCPSSESVSEFGKQEALFSDNDALVHENI